MNEGGEEFRIQIHFELINSLEFMVKIFKIKIFFLW